jgi:exodeoxyribonuclease V alpha subunit
VKLDRIHRQGETSYIPIVANDIAAGKSYEFPTDASDIKYHHVSGEEYKNYITKFIEEYLDSNPISDLQIISPQYKGLMGVDTTNTIVQEIMSEYNKSYKMMEYGFKKFFKGDRVLQLDNNYDKEVFNGDLGIVVDLGEKIIDRTVSDKMQKYIIVDFYGREVLYVGDEILQSLTLAWCCTVHKFQGSQSKHIVFLASSEFQYMMNKELVYTAITRAEKLLHIIGDYNMIRLSANRSSIKTRYTHFNELNSSDIVILHQLK